MHICEQLIIFQLVIFQKSLTFSMDILLYTLPMGDLYTNQKALCTKGNKLVGTSFWVLLLNESTKHKRCSGSIQYIMYIAGKCESRL